MGLKIFWDLPNVFEYFVASHQELEAMRNRLFRPGRTPSVEEKVQLGELFVSLLQQARQRHTRRVREALAPYCVEMRIIDAGEERLIMKLACLVQRDRQGQWEEGVRQAAGLFDDHYRFDYNGPWPPYNFADIDLRLSVTAMFLLDDLLLAPIKGLAAVCQKVHEAAEEDLEAQEKAVLADLAELHHLLAVARSATTTSTPARPACWTVWTRAGSARGRGFPAAGEESPQENDHAR